jgi:hypothetical protein
MRRAFALPVALATAVVGLGLVAPVSAPASCVGPKIAVTGVAAATSSPDPSTGVTVTTVFLRRGEPVTVTGRWFFRGCHDTSSSSGCSSSSPPQPEKPRRDVRLVLTQGSRSWLLGTADAGPPRRQYPVQWQVAVPTDARPGPAVLSAGPITSVQVVVASR